MTVVIVKFDQARQNTMVTIPFAFSYRLACAAGEGECGGVVRWETVSSDWWGESKQEGHARPHIIPTDVVGKGSETLVEDGGKTKFGKTKDQEYKALLPSARPLFGVIIIKAALECPIGTKVSEKTLRFVIDSELEGSYVDGDASDLDADGLTGAEERNLGTDPGKMDTDKDGKTDGDDPYPLDPRKQ